MYAVKSIGRLDNLYATVRRSVARKAEFEKCTFITNRLRVPSSTELALLRRPAASFSLVGAGDVVKSGDCNSKLSGRVWCFSLGRLKATEGNAGGSDLERERALGSAPTGTAR